MNTCKICKHFAPEDDGQFGGCAASGYWQGASDERTDKSMSKAYAWDTEGYFAAIRVGRDFGCVNWEPK